MLVIKEICDDDDDDYDDDDGSHGEITEVNFAFFVTINENQFSVWMIMCLMFINCLLKSMFSLK